MSSNSIRVGGELFVAAQQQGRVMSRSAAQQVEHWARIGAALEAVGLSVAEVAELLHAGSPVQETQDPWAFKRAQQARDLQNSRSSMRSTGPSCGVERKADGA